MLGRFVSSLFYLGDEPNKPKGILFEERGDATHADIISFVQRQAVLDVTEKYFSEISRMWRGSNCGRDPLVRVPGTPGVISKQNTMQAPAARMEAPTENDQATQQPHHVVQTGGLAAPRVPSLRSPSCAAGITAVQEEMKGSTHILQTPDSPQTPITPLVSEATQPTSSTPINHEAKAGQISPTKTQAGKQVDLGVAFHLPNAQAGQEYSGVLEGRDLTGKPISIIDVKIPESIGLTFELKTCLVRGTPVVPGDHKIAIKWSSADGPANSAECTLVVNPDPRTLWKNIDPPSNDSYFKENSDGKYLAFSGHSLVAASRRGRSHEHSGTFRDDDFFLEHDDKSEWSVMIVADGAGSAKNSRWGSKLAVKAFGEHVMEQLQGEFGGRMTATLAEWGADSSAAAKTLGTEFHYLFHKAGTLAVQAIEAEAQAKGAAYKEYSTTLLAAATRTDGDDIFLATFWMGDGAIAAYGPRGKVRLMGTPDGGEFAGQTRFLDRSALADQSFAKRIGIGYYPDLSAVLLMTDGISDPRFETDNGLINAALWDTLWDEINPKIENAEPVQALVDWLGFFSPGHHDDRTIAVLS
jgi:hypothetical protein